LKLCVDELCATIDCVFFGFQSDLHDMVTRVRNPLMHPKFVLSKIFSGKNIDDPKATLNLNYNLHPSLDPAAQSLEYSTIRLQIATETLLSRYGAGVVDKTAEVTRLTDAVVLLYAMYAATARASRAYCIGLRNADYEMLLANTFCLDNAKQIWQLVKDIDKGTHELNDYNYEKVGKKLFASNKYFLEHPLTRNF
jgi:acyl-CoA dehydrogenase family member 9